MLIIAKFVNEQECNSKRLLPNIQISALARSRAWSCPTAPTHFAAWECPNFPLFRFIERDNVWRVSPRQSFVCQESSRYHWLLSQTIPRRMECVSVGIFLGDWIQSTSSRDTTLALTRKVSTFFWENMMKKGLDWNLGNGKPVESTGVQAKKIQPNQPWGTNPSIYAPPTRWNLPRLYIYSQFAFCNQQENLSYAFPPSAHLFTSRRKIFPFFRNPLWSLTPKLSR